MIEVHVREEQAVPPRRARAAVARAPRVSAERPCWARYRRPPPGRRTTTMCEASICGPHIFRVDGGDAVGERRQSWHDCIHGLRQHSSMNRKLLLDSPDHGLASLVAQGAVEERGNLVLDNIPSVDTPLTVQPRRLPELAWRKFRRLATRWRRAHRHALRRRRAAASRDHARSARANNSRSIASR